MVEGGNRRAVVWGLFFIAAGIAFLLDRLDVWTLRARYVLPMLLIVLGGAILLGGRGWVRGGRD
jgi:LiaI-LiaF-like transmembrane region